ncbi:BLOC-1-related complex subunit 8 isoform X3 [Bubalus kerabau]|uniref:BLOC-1-related complex subunit 8 isoform X3 n=1 Tax=Bubalus carabanensis TaxID=3119969 RepID=UPI00244E6EE1|nr:BLOC-1-related complex subunit 8 isoform X3 [Bubalus carabanensis]
MEEPEMQLKGKKVTDKFTESVYVLANEPSVALYRLQEHVRRSLPELAQHKADMQRWEEQSQGAIYTVEYACRLLPRPQQPPPSVTGGGHKDSRRCLKRPVFPTYSQDHRLAGGVDGSRG